MRLIRILALCFFVIPIVGTLVIPQSAFAGPAGDSSDDSDVPRRFAMNIKNYAVTPEIFHDASYRALIKRGWQVELNEATHLVGKRNQGSEVFKVDISWIGDIVTVAFVPGFHNSYGRNWLKYLGKDIQREIKPLKNKNIKVVPPSAPGT